MPFEKLEFERLWTVNAPPEKGGFERFVDSEDQVRKDYQYHPDAIKTFINNLLTVLESAEAAGLIGDGQKGNLEATLAHIYGEVARVEDDLKTLASGGTPQAVRTAVVGFDEGAWTAGDSANTMAIGQDIHGRNSAAFGYQLWAEADGVMRSDVWLAAGTDVAYQDDGTIVLTAEEPYAGRIAFFGV